MSYHVTVLRTSGSAEKPITQTEIASACAADPRWTFDDTDQCLTYRDEKGVEVLSLWLDEGKLWTGNPDADAFALMLALADKLGARVRGDELETYRSAEETYIHPDDADLVEKAEQQFASVSRKAKVRHVLFRTYQVGITSFLIFLAIRYVLKH